MPHSLIGDELPLDPRWGALSGGRAALEHELVWAYVRLMCASARYLNDGYLTHHQATKTERVRPVVLDLLCRPVHGEPPFIHRPGQSCAVRNCLDASGPWREGFDYRICGYLKRNPSRSENARNKAQKADSRDARLRGVVYDRDGGCCRYCGSGPLKKRGMGKALDRRRVLQYDHVDPDQPASPPGRAEGSNYVVACARCNEMKSGRTPDEAGLVLRPEPSAADREAWSARGEMLFDLPEPPAHGQPTRQTTKQTTDKQQNKQHDKERLFVPTSVPTSVPTHVGDNPAGDESAGQPQRQPPDMSAEGSGSGRVGEALSVGVNVAAKPPRSGDFPDPYTKRSRGTSET